MKEPLQIRLEVYKYLREEIINSINLQHRTFISESFFISVVFSLSLMQTQIQTNLKPLILSITPAVIGLTSLWLIEQSRMMRAGEYLCLLEDEINSSATVPCLTWENWLRREGVPFWDIHRIHHIAQMIIMFSFITVASFSIYLIWTWPLGVIELELQHKIAAAYAILLSPVVAMVIYVIFHRRPKITEIKTLSLSSWEQDFYKKDKIKTAEK